MNAGAGLFKKAFFAQLAVASFFWQPEFWKDLQASLSNSVNVTQQVTGVCDRDGKCEKDMGENILNCPEDCQPSTFSKGGDRAILNNPVTIWGVRVADITEKSAKIEWYTDYDGICALQWGVTPEFENTNAEGTPIKYHFSILQGLLSDKTYYFKVVCSAGENIQSTEEMQFKTLKGLDVTAPENVTGLNAAYNPDENKIVLEWKNPQSDFSGAAALRNEKYFPRDQWDGYPICQGGVRQCVDMPVDPGKKYYYGVFTYDASGNYSSGAGVVVTTGQEKAAPDIIQVQPEEEAETLTANDFKFYQNGVELKMGEGGRFVAKANEMIEVKIDYERFIENSKNAYLTIGCDSNTQTYIFRANGERSAYISDIVLREPEIYSYTIFVTTYADVVYQIDGKILLEGGTGEADKNFTENVMDEAIPDLLLLLIVALTIEAIFRKKKKKKIPKKTVKMGDDEEVVYL